VTRDGTTGPPETSWRAGSSDRERAPGCRGAGPISQPPKGLRTAVFVRPSSSSLEIPIGLQSPALPPKLPGTAGPFQVRTVDYRPGTRMPPHTHDLPSVTLVLAGAIRETVGSVEDDAGPLSVVVKPAGVRHADVFGPRGARTLQIVWHRGWEASESHGILAPGWAWHHLPRGTPEFLALARDARDARAPSTALESRIWDALAALEASAETQGTGGPAPGWLVRVKEELDDRMDEGVEVRELAEAAGLHPGSLSRAFRRHFGDSVTGYRARERLRRAVQALTSRAGSLSRIAHQAGYADHPHLCRAVRSATGLTPSELRRLLLLTE
jgi:AraC family transcriptional regulator